MKCAIIMSVPHVNGHERFSTEALAAKVGIWRRSLLKPTMAEACRLIGTGLVSLGFPLIWAIGIDVTVPRCNVRSGVGARIRHLPIRPGEVLEALKTKREKS